MARPTKNNGEMEAAARYLVNQVETARELRTPLSVLIPKRCSVANVDAGLLLGVGIATVDRMQRQIHD
jgi:hypothetical protein